jgi:predicted nucleic acid-binding protein
MDALSGLAPGSLVLVDTGALVYLVEGEGARRRAVEACFAVARAGRIRLVASAIAWTELFDGAFAMRDAELETSYRILLSDASIIQLAPVDAAVAEEAARLIADSRPGSPPQAGQRPRGAQARALGLADAIHIATAVVLGARAVLGNDEAWREVPACPPLLLVDELAFEFGP